MITPINAPDLSSLTDRQAEIYRFIRQQVYTRGYGPTVREIAHQFNIGSPNGVMSHLKALEKKGWISREAKMSRAIQLKQLPHASLPYGGTIS